MNARDVFILTRDTRPSSQGTAITYWAWSPDGPVQIVPPPQESVFFVPRDTETHAGRRDAVSLATLKGEPVDVVRFADARTRRQEATRLKTLGTPAWEAEVKAADRFLMERFITGGCRIHGEPADQQGVTVYRHPRLEPADVTPELRVASFDVEAHSRDGPTLSIATVVTNLERVFVLGEGTSDSVISYCATERKLLEGFLDFIAEIDPDVLIGWNVVDFDLQYLGRRCAAFRIPFAMGRLGGIARILRGEGSAPTVALVPGRVVLDGIATMRAATWSFERWSLEHVGQELLGRGKAIAKTLDPLEEIRRLYREDLPALIEYNLEDCRLVRDVFDHAQVLEFAIERQRLTGLTMDRRAGSVAAFDFLYLPRLHRRGRVAPSVGTNPNVVTSPGGYVLDSRPGLYQNVLVLDFKSLYPSIIRTFLIDPLGMTVGLERNQGVAGFGGAIFDRKDHILPSLIEALWSSRDAAKKRQDAAMSRAIKVLMNSFYGVLGSPVCRFFDPRLASSITRRGHEILTRSRDFIEAAGWPVIYGDTDSLFVLVGPDHQVADCAAIGADLAQDLNTWWQATLDTEHGLPSALEVEFETHYEHFLMPTMRGSKEGSKKRYAGMVRRHSELRLVVKGLEAVRTDWTPLARRFQRELLRRVFLGEEFKDWVSELSNQLRAGQLDDELTYHKRLRRDQTEYTKTTPPHVAAARLLEKHTGHRVRDIDYVITTRGAQPIALQSAPIDYEHYVHKQLAPAGDTVLRFVGTSFLKLGGRQLSLF